VGGVRFLVVSETDAHVVSGLPPTKKGRWCGPGISNSLSSRQYDASAGCAIGKYGFFSTSDLKLCDTRRALLPVCRPRRRSRNRRTARRLQIGRASCREREEIAGVDGQVETNKNKREEENCK